MLRQQQLDRVLISRNKCLLSDFNTDIGDGEFFIYSALLRLGIHHPPRLSMRGFFCDVYLDWTVIAVSNARETLGMCAYLWF